MASAPAARRAGTVCELDKVDVVVIDHASSHVRDLCAAYHISVMNWWICWRPTRRIRLIWMCGSGRGMDWRVD